MTPSYKVVLYENETVERGDVVYLDGQPIGTVTDIEQLNNNLKVAIFALDRNAYRSQLLEGTLRSSDSTQIFLTSPSNETDKDPLIPMSIIQGQTLGEELTRKWFTLPNLIMLSVFLLVVLLSILVLKKSFQVLLIAGCKALAAVAAYFLHPAASPYLLELMNRWNAWVARNPDLSENLALHPNPTILAIFAIFLFTFIASMALIARPIKKWTS